MTTNVVLPRSIAAAVTTAGALAAGKHNRVDATAGALTMTLPAASPGNAGASLSVEKIDTSSNTVTVSGSIRGATTTLTLAWQFETIEFIADSNGSWFPAAGHKTKAALDRAYAPIRRLSGLPAQPIASGGGAVPNNNNSVSATTGFTTRSAYKAAVAATDLQLVFPLGFFLTSPGALAETAMASVTIPGFKAAIELSNGTIWPVFFRGSRTVNIDPWGTVTSDPIALEIAAGDVFYVRSYIATGATGTTGIPLPRSFPAHGPGITLSGNVGFSNAGDNVDSGGTFTNDLNYAYGAPIVCGQPTGAPTATIGIVGDSISGGMGSLNGSSAWWKYGLNNAFPTVQYDRSGIAAQGIAVAHQRGFPLLQGLTHALVLLGTNDFQSRTLAQMQADLTTIWTALANRGIKVYGATLPPGTTSTDSWATTTNQTVRAAEAVRVGFNNWVRTTPAPLTGYMEIADACETARNSGLWKVNGTANYGTADGTHPTDILHQAMGAVIPTGSFTV